MKAVRPSLNDENLVDETLNEAERDFVLGPSVGGKELGHRTNAPDVFGTVFNTERQVGAQAMVNVVAIEDICPAAV